MADIPKYRIINCCGGVQIFAQINLNDAGAFQSGLHTYTGVGGIDIPGDNGTLTLNTGQCYIILEIMDEGVLPDALSYDDFTDLEFGLSGECSAYAESSCNCPWLYYVSPCCPEAFGLQGASAQQVNLFLSDLEYEEGTYQYIGASNEVLGTDLILEPGQCYTITRNLEDDPIQTLIELDFSTTNWQQMNLELGCIDNRCLDCPEEGITYLKYEPCCDSFDTIYVQTRSYTGEGMNSAPESIVNIAGYTGVFQFGATSQASQLSAFIPGQCYTGTLHTLGTEAAPAPQDNGDYSDLPLAPYSTQLSKVGDCERPPCPECNPIVYALTNCDGITINTETDLSAYVGTYVEIETPNGVVIPGCWFVQEYSPIVVNPGLGSTIDPSSEVGVGKIAISAPNLPNTLPGLQTQPVTVTGPCECECKCYEVIGYSGTYSYIDCETGKSLLVFSSGADKFCAATAPNIVGREGIDYTLVISDCVDGECVDKCFLLTNCDPTAWPLQDATLNSTLQSLSQYANTDEVVVLSGYDGCWTVTEAVECDCPVDVTVIRDYRDCEECLGITAYKLSNCEKINEVVYTLQDFSAYVGQVIKDDCTCWVVEEIDYQPPSETTIVDPIVFEDCTTCLTTYYTLTDCDDPTSIIISSTNLSAYVNQWVKLEGCIPCYRVALYEDTVAPAQWEEVTVTEASATCFDCKQLVPRCSTVFNNSTEDRFFTYINANGDPEQTEVVNSGHFSLRTCVQYWTEPDTFIYDYHGDCTVYEYPTSPEGEPCDCFTLISISDTNVTYTLQAVHFGQMYNNDRVWQVTIEGVPYFVWSPLSFTGGWIISQQVGGPTSISDLTVFGSIKSGVLDCPAGPDEANPVNWGGGGTIPGFPSKVGSAVSSLTSFVVACSGGSIVTKVGFCVQYFPNDRKVKPGYNTPICSADKYDKITCNAAEIMYKKALELRYGISNCCPEEDEKWLISKELIELQALTDPNYTCDPLTDCCGQPTSSCSCNS